MKVWTKLMTVLAVVMMAGVLNAADAPKPDAPKKKEKDSIKGDVVKVDGTNLIISAGKKKDKKEVTIATDAKTAVIIEGKEGKLADLKAGQKVHVTPETGTAQRIEVPIPKAAKPAAPAAPAK